MCMSTHLACILRMRMSTHRCVWVRILLKGLGPRILNIEYRISNIEYQISKLARSSLHVVFLHVASYCRDSNALHGFTTSFVDGNSEKLNTQIYFDTDSVFFVCNNSTTGHICNDIRKFIPGSLCQTNKSLTTANGTGPCLQEGTVWLHLNNDDGVKHIFILDNCLFHLDSPVNLLSTRRLAEKFINEQGNPDKQTRIESWYSTHVLTWSFGNFKKTFPTPLSGLPELLFDEGFQAYMSFCMQISSYATKDANSTSTFIPFEDNK
jgi:hypothetical protein